MNLKSKIYNSLRWSEKYAKTDMVYLTKGGFWLTFEQIISSASVFFLAIAFANLLPKEIYGTYKYALSIMGILIISNLPGMGTAITQAVARGYEGSVIDALKTKIRWSSFAVLASLAIAAYYYFHNNTVLAISFLIAAAFLPFLESFDIYNSFLIGKQLFKPSSRSKIITQIIAAVILIITLFLTQNVFLILLAYFLPLAALRFTFFKITFKKFQPNQNSDRETIPYGKHLTIINAIAVVSAQIDKILIFGYLGAAELAIYSFAIALPDQTKGWMKSLADLIFPKFSVRDSGEIRAHIKEKFIKFFFLSVLIVGFYILMAPFIYNTFFPQYKESIFLSQLFSISMLNITFIPSDVFMLAKKKIKEQYLVNIIHPIFTIAIMAVFIIWQGLLGLIIARILSRFSGSFLNLIFFYRSSRETAE